MYEAGPRNLDVTISVSPILTYGVDFLMHIRIANCHILMCYTRRHRLSAEHAVIRD